MTTPIYPIQIGTAQSSPNFDWGRFGSKIDRIIIHDMEAHFHNGEDWLDAPVSQVSAHYTISEDGTTVDRLVDDANTAWHAGIWGWNTCSIGIENAGFKSGQYQDDQMRTCAWLTVSLCKKHGLGKPKFGVNVFRHQDVPPPNDHTDPGPNWDMTKFQAMCDQFWGDSTTVSAGAGGTPDDPNAHNFTETGYWLTNVVPNGTTTNFYTYWKTHGGLTHFGYPISPTYFDGEINRVVQYTQRSRLELHPESQGTPFEVQEGLLGVEVLQLRQKVLDLLAENTRLQHALDNALPAPATPTTDHLQATLKPDQDVGGNATSQAQADHPLAVETQVGGTDAAGAQQEVVNLGGFLGNVAANTTEASSDTNDVTDGSNKDNDH